MLRDVPELSNVDADSVGGVRWLGGPPGIEPRKKLYGGTLHAMLIDLTLRAYYTGQQQTIDAMNCVLGVK
jgi:hypothetical protein